MSRSIATMSTDRQDHADEQQVLGLVGDVNVQQRERPRDAFVNVEDALRDLDVLFGHLEGPLSPPSDDPHELDVPHKPLWRHSDPAMVEGLVSAGFAAMSCASNVTYPRRVAVSTRRTLRDAGIAACGVGRNRAEAHEPAIVAKRGVTYGFLSYTSVFWPVEHAAGDDLPGVATMRAHTSYGPGRRALEMPGAPPEVVTQADPEELGVLVDDVRRLRARADVVVLSCHWGVSGSDEPVDYQRQVGRAAIDAGADIVVGHHPHVIQEVELHAGRPIFYSLGNFAFDWPKMRGRNLDGLLVRCTVRGGRLAAVGIVPVRRDDDNLIAPLDAAAGTVVLERLAERSAVNGTAIVHADGQWTLPDLEVRP